jgi:hypothetical protein
MSNNQRNTYSKTGTIWLVTYNAEETTKFEKAFKFKPLLIGAQINLDFKRFLTNI